MDCSRFEGWKFTRKPNAVPNTKGCLRFESSWKPWIQSHDQLNSKNEMQVFSQDLPLIKLFGETFFWIITDLSFEKNDRLLAVQASTFYPSVFNFKERAYLSGETNKKVTPLLHHMKSWLVGPHDGIVHFKLQRGRISVSYLTQKTCSVFLHCSCLCEGTQHMFYGGPCSIPILDSFADVVVSVLRKARNNEIRTRASWRYCFFMFLPPSSQIDSFI